MRNLISKGLILLIFLSTQLIAQEEATHDQLRTLKDNLIKAVNSNEVDQLLPFLHENLVLTTEAGDVVRTKKGAKEFINRVMEGPDRLFEGFTVEDVEVDEASILYGNNTAIAFGEVTSNYNLVGGKKLKIPSRWTATLIKENDNWLLASFQNTVNVFDNPISEKIQTFGYLLAIGCFFAGLVLGLFLNKKSKR